MANKFYEEEDIRAIADAIREKTGGTETYKVGEMGAALNSDTQMINTEVSEQTDLISQIKTALEGKAGGSGGGSGFPSDIIDFMYENAQFQLIDYELNTNEFVMDTNSYFDALYDNCIIMATDGSQYAWTVLCPSSNAFIIQYSGDYTLDIYFEGGIFEMHTNSTLSFSDQPLWSYGDFISEMYMYFW